MIQHYMVVSPTMTRSFFDGDEPHEEYACVATVEAPNKTKAKALAIQDPDFRDWVDRQRGDNASPFTGVKVFEQQCEHGICSCWDCRGECPQCDAACEEVIRLENESE